MVPQNYSIGGDSPVKSKVSAQDDIYSQLLTTITSEKRFNMKQEAAYMFLGKRYPGEKAGHRQFLGEASRPDGGIKVRWNLLLGHLALMPSPRNCRFVCPAFSPGYLFPNNRYKRLGKMGSDSNRMNDGTGFQPSEQGLCANGCGFYGSANQNNLCSKCYSEQLNKNEKAASAKVAMNKVFSFSKVDSSSSCSSSSAAVQEVAKQAVLEEVIKVKVTNRCFDCNKKVGVMGFKCRCGETFCGSHRYPEEHKCEFDFKKTGRDFISKANPVVKADKVDRI